jgi:hypothetical protein
VRPGFGWLEHFFYNEHYATDERAVDAGFILQIDDPVLPDIYDMIVPAPGIEEYRK